MKFRKKPIVIEAFQLTADKRIDNSDWPRWMHDAWNLDRGVTGSLYPTKYGGDSYAKYGGTLSIRTLEGTMRVDFNDWIIKGINGELYPCKLDIFEKTYEPIIEVIGRGKGERGEDSITVKVNV